MVSATSALASVRVTLTSGVITVDGRSAQVPHLRVALQSKPNSLDGQLPHATTVVNA
jgi:hypothetical protein